MLKTKLTLTLGAIALLMALSLTLAGQAAAKTINVQEEAALKVTENNEQTRETKAAGTGKGTFDGKVHLTVHVINGSKLSAKFVTEGRDGSFTGVGQARYSVSGSILRFFGTVTVTGGSGSYEKARGHGIEIEGVLNRVKERVTLTMDGQLSY